MVFKNLVSGIEALMVHRNDSLKSLLLGSYFARVNLADSCQGRFLQIFSLQKFMDCRRFQARKNKYSHVFKCGLKISLVGSVG